MRNAPVLLVASLAAKARQVYMPVRGPQTGATDDEKRRESTPAHGHETAARRANARADQYNMRF